MDSVRNDVHKRAGIERELASTADQRVLRLFGYVERINEFRMIRRVVMADVSGGRVWGRPGLGWMDGVKVALGSRRMIFKVVPQSVKDKKEWRALVLM